jgi:hypothetical protein
MHARLHAHACTHTHTHACTLARMHTHTHTYTHARAHARLHTRTHARTHACTHAHARTRTRTHACTRTHTHTHTCTRTHARTRAHRRTHLRSCAVVACVGADAVLRSNLIGTPTSGPDVAGVSELQCRRRCGRGWAQSPCRYGRGNAARGLLSDAMACGPDPDLVVYWRRRRRQRHAHEVTVLDAPVARGIPTLPQASRAMQRASGRYRRPDACYGRPRRGLQGRAQRGLSLAAAPTCFHCAQTGQGSARAFTCCGADGLSLCPNRAHSDLRAFAARHHVRRSRGW